MDCEGGRCVERACAPPAAAPLAAGPPQPPHPTPTPVRAPHLHLCISRQARLQQLLPLRGEHEHRIAGVRKRLLRAAGRERLVAELLLLLRRRRLQLRIQHQREPAAGARGAGQRLRRGGAPALAACGCGRSAGLRGLHCSRGRPASSALPQVASAQGGALARVAAPLARLSLARVAAPVARLAALARLAAARQRRQSRAPGAVQRRGAAARQGGGGAAAGRVARAGGGAQQQLRVGSAQRPLRVGAAQRPLRLRAARRPLRLRATQRPLRALSARRPLRARSAALAASAQRRRLGGVPPRAQRLRLRSAALRRQAGRRGGARGIRRHTRRPRLPAHGELGLLDLAAAAAARLGRLAVAPGGVEQARARLVALRCGEVQLQRRQQRRGQAPGEQQEGRVRALARHVRAEGSEVRGRDFDWGGRGAGGWKGCDRMESSRGVRTHATSACEERGELRRESHAECCTLRAAH